VEEKDQVAVLSAIGCDIIQGNYLSKPVPVQEIPDLMYTDLKVICPP